MIKARTAIDGKPTLIFGLTPGNITGLMAGRPIHVNCAELGMPGLHAIIVGDQTREAIIRNLAGAGLIDAATAAAVLAADDGEGN